METDRPIQPAATIEAGLEALAQGDWEGARSAFSGVVQVDETPEALEGLGMAAWWLEDDRTAIEARRRAYRLYQDRGDRRSASGGYGAGPGLLHPRGGSMEQPATLQGKSLESPDETRRSVDKGKADIGRS